MRPLNDYINYVDYLNDWILSRPKKGHGKRAEMAKFLGIIPTHVSKILRGEAKVTLDQAVKLISFLELTKLEGQYFFGLVELARAGNDETRDFINERLEEISEKLESPTREGIEKREHEIEDMQTYFSSYLYNSIEIITFIDKFQTVSSVSKYFNISKKKTLEILNFLVKIGTVKKQREKYVNVGGTTWYKMPREIAKKNTANWRIKAVASLDYDEDVYYHRNVNFAIERSRIPEVKKIIFDAIMEVSKKPQEKADMICSYCVDLFEIK